MDKKMEEIDLLIKETLTQEEAKFYDELEEQNIFEMLAGMFKGKNSWLIYVMNVITLALLFCFAYCAIQFNSSEETNELIRWGGGALLFFIVIAILKVFVWLQMDKNAILREMKRIELQISSLSGKMK